MGYNSIYFNWFWNSLRKDQKKEFHEMSINQQKDWYINYLQDNYIPKNYLEKLEQSYKKNEAKK